VCDGVFIVLVVLWSTGVPAGAQRHHPQPPIVSSPLEGLHAPVGATESAQNTHLTVQHTQSTDLKRGFIYVFIFL